MSWDKFEKLAELLKRRITEIVMRRLKDPRIGFVTITRIDLARDLKLCKVYYTVFGSKGEITRTTCAFKDARGFIQKAVSKTLRTRTMPKLEFLLDDSIDGVERVNRIFNTLAEERRAHEDELDESDEIPEDEIPEDEIPEDEIPEDE